MATVEAGVAIEGIPTPWGESRAIAEGIRTLTRPEESVFVWGDAPLLYILSGRRMAGPYAHLMPVIPEWSGKERLVDLLDRLARLPPRLVIVAPGKLWWRHGEEANRLLGVFPDMKRMLEDRYRLAFIVQGFEYWQRTE